MEQERLRTREEKCMVCFKGIMQKSTKKKCVDRPSRNAKQDSEPFLAILLKEVSSFLQHCMIQILIQKPRHRRAVVLTKIANLKNNTYSLAHMPNFDIVIVGGGFCGVHVAKQIEKKLPKVTAALIDHKEFFEFTPAVPKIVTDPAHVNKIRVPYARLFKRVSFIKTELLSVSPARVRTKQGEFSFKYLVIATGSKYPAPAGTSALKSSEDALKLNQKLAGASSVMIIGGGLVGTELAGELVTKTDKKVTLLEPSQRILGRNTERASSWAQNYLTMNGCDIIFGERVNKASAKSVTTSHGVRKADVIVWCAGIKSESGFLEGSL